MIIYVGNFQFPYGDAVGRRVYAIGLTIQQAGYKFGCIGMAANIPKNTISSEMQYNEILYCNIHKTTSLVERYQTNPDLQLILEKIASWHRQYQVEAVVFCGMKSALFANKFVNGCHKLGISVIADSMDWLEYHTGNFVFDTIKQWDVDIEIKHVNSKADGVICISTFLESFYKEKNKKTVVIPAISSLSLPQRTELLNPLEIVYAGIPCRLGRPLRNRTYAKDRLDLAMELLFKVQKAGVPFVFRVFGLTQEEYCTIFPQHLEMVLQMCKAGRVVFYGFVRSDVVEQSIARAAFTILIRENNRTTKAGFATKLGESVALGTPVITTDAGDAKLYIRDNKDGIFLDITDMDNAKDTLVQYLKDSGKINQMQEAVRENTYFAPERYAEKMRAFLKEIAKG